MIKYAYTKEFVETEKPVAAYCDICKNEIKNKRDYYDVTTGHHDWGMDSGDSVQYFHICSEDCLKKIFDRYIKSSMGNTNTEYIDINHSIMKVEDF